uniref:Uncharacterized protein n=1 Tax=Anopheles culicifacies TaxID=139723 RepID=A0A182MHX5_9DIPT
MMSQHINSMLEHLKMGSLMSKGGSGGKQQQQVTPTASANGSVVASASSGAPNGSCTNNNLHCNHHGGSGTGGHNNNNNTSSINANHNSNCHNGGPLAGGKMADTTVLVERREVAEGRESSKANHVGEERRGYDVSRKRCSISVQQHGGGGGQDGGGNIRTNYRELSPASLRIHRKSSHDIRNTLLGPDGEVLHLHDPSGKGGDGMGKMPAVVKPIKLKSIVTKAESYDTMHGKASDHALLENTDQNVWTIIPHKFLEGTVRLKLKANPDLIKADIGPKSPCCGPGT